MMRHLKTKTTKIVVPKSLEMTIIKIRAEQELDWDEACEHLAELAEPNGKKFKEAVAREANRRYKSRHMKELNKSKKSYIDRGYQAGATEGFFEGQKYGHDEAVKEWRVSYPCSVCGELIPLKPGEKSTQDAVEYLKSQGWHHTTCPKK